MKSRMKEHNACPSEESKEGAKRIYFQRYLMMAALLVIAVAVLLTGGSQASAADLHYSKWIKDLSALADPDALYYHQDPKVVTSGKYVHVMWKAWKTDFTTGTKLFYARSTNGGKSFLTPVALASLPSMRGVEFPAEWKNLAASGPYVHVVYHSGWPTNMIYLRSQDNGATFQQTTLSSGYYTYSGVFICAEGGKVALAWGRNDGNAGNPKDIFWSYSTDGGATLQTTQMAHSEGTAIYTYTVHDAVRSGGFVYVLTSTMDQNSGLSSQQHLYLWASTNGGATFKPPVKVNVKAVNDGYYLVGQARYSPKLAASGKEVNVVWLNVDNTDGDGWMALTLRVRKSSNAGTSLADSVILHTFPEGYQSTHGANTGLETIVRKGQNVYMSTVISSGDPGTYLWRSTDGGATWGARQLISHGGWWPIVMADPVTPDRIHLVNSSYYRSDDSGESFDSGVNPHFNFGSWDSPQLAVDSTGIPHYVGKGTMDSGGGDSDNRILYRRLAPEQEPGSLNKAVRLQQNSLYGRTLGDHLQIPATPAVNFSNALTVEFWVKRFSDDYGYFEKLVNKKRTSGYGSYMLGAWGADMKIYSRIVTDKTDPDGGVFLLTDTVLSKNKWTHIAMTYAANAGTDNLRLYVNGKLAAKTTVTGLIQTETADAPLVIGEDNTDGTDGTVAIDELCLWNRARTLTQIRQDMGRRLTGTETGLASYYSFDGTFKELTGHGTNALPMYHETYVPGPVLEPTLSLE